MESDEAKRVRSVGLPGRAEPATRCQKAAAATTDPPTRLSVRGSGSRTRSRRAPQYEPSPLFSDLERWIICYAEEITKSVHVDGKLAEELKQDLSPEALMQLILTIAASNSGTV